MLKNFKRVLITLFAVALIAVVVPSVAQAQAVKAEDKIPSDETVVTEYADETVVAAADAQETLDNGAKGSKALAAAIAVGLAAALGALAMGIAIAKSNEAIARQPEAGSQIKSGLMLGLVFIETAIIYALIVAILVIFVL